MTHIKADRFYIYNEKKKQVKHKSLRDTIKKEQLLIIYFLLKRLDFVNLGKIEVSLDWG